MSSETLKMPEKKSGFISLIERVGHKIPDPVVIFMSLLVITAITSVLMGGHTFQSVGSDGGIAEYSIKNMMAAENVRWLFDNAILRNWLPFGNAVLGVILLAVLGVGIAEKSGLLDTLINTLKSKEALLHQVNPKIQTIGLDESSSVRFELASESVELDEQLSCVKDKSNQRWLWLAIDHDSGRVLAYVFGKRKDAISKRLKAMLEPFGMSRFYTDDGGCL